MELIALEQSTDRASLAWLRDGLTIATRSWTEPRKRDQQVMGAIKELCAEAGRTVNELDAGAVGLGPGSFSGVRIAIAALCGLGFDGPLPLVGISSAAALAHDVASGDSDPVIILGDARRRRLWIAAYAGDQERVALQLVAHDQAASMLPAHGCVVSPDAHRLSDVLPGFATATRQVILERQTPTANAVGELAYHQLQADTVTTTTLNPPQPLYLHPAVFANPRY